jgi:hypothetical protein
MGDDCEPFTNECSHCGKWEWYCVCDYEDNTDDCLNCGVCDFCIDQSIAAAEEHD